MTKPTPPHHSIALSRRHFLAGSARVAVGGTALSLAARPAWANRADARSVALDHTHTREQLSLVYAADGQYLPTAMDTLNHFLRDHYSGEVGVIDPQLIDLLHRLRQTLQASQPFQVISAYRSPATNDRLRNTRGGGVAKHSLHMDGQAIDIRLPGIALADLRDAALTLRAGGVGYYPREQFVHIDVGRVRSW